MTELVRVGPLEEREPPLWQVYWRALKSRRIVLLAGALIGALAAWAVATLRAPVFEAMTTLEMRTPNEAFLGLEDLSREASQSRYPQRSELQTNVRLLEARSLALRTSEELAAAGRGLEQPLREASAALDVRADDDSRVLEVRTRASDPAVAATFVNRLSDNFIAEQTERQRTEAEQTRAWVDSQLQVFRRKLEVSESKLQDYVAGNGLLHAAQEDLSGWERLRALERELDSARAEAARLRIRADLASGSSSSMLDARGALDVRRGELAQLQRRLAELEALYRPEHYQVKQVAAQVRSVEQNLASERTRLEQDSRREHVAAARLVSELERQYRTARAAMAGDQRRSVEYELLRREAGADRELYDTFLARARQADLAAAAPAAMLRVIDPAIPPSEPVYPNAPLAGGAGFAFGLAVAAAWALARERLDRTFHAPGELATRLQVHELGAVPDASIIELDRSGTVAEVAAEQSRLRPVEVLTADPEGPQEIAECFRAVRSSLLRDDAGAAPTGVFVITSPGAGDGKTTVATNLAIAMAELDQPTLLIDADMLKPRVHRLFGLINRNGLADLLQAEETIEAALDTAIRQVPEVPNLSVLPAGVVVQGGRGLLHSRRMAELLQRLRRRYPTVVLDCPPMLEVSDARTLARWADRVALVVRAGHTPPEAVIAAVETLAADGAPLMGTVLNSFDPRTRRRYVEYVHTAA